VTRSPEELARAAEIEGIEGRGLSWAAALGVVRPAGSQPLPARRIDRLRKTLDRAIRRLSSRFQTGVAGRTAEWLLDNTWLAQRAIDVVAESLPPGFCRRLPATRSGVARVETLAWAIVREHRSWLEPEDLRRWVDGVQKQDPLTIGEIWALPAMVRWVLLEDLVASAADAAGLDPIGSPRRVGERPADPDPDRVPACIQSLRSFNRHDWKKFFESTSVVESTLRRDPCGAYPDTTFATRDRFRKAVEELARRSPASEVEVAETAVRLAEGAADDGDPRRRHVGFWLASEGRLALEGEIGFRPPLRLRLRRRVRPVKVQIYITGLLLTTAILAIAFAAPCFNHGKWTVLTALVLSLLPASVIADAAAHWAVSRLVRPRVLPKLEFHGMPPPEATTTIVVPALFADRAEMEKVLRSAERNWLGNAGAVQGVALLLDYPDAPRASMPADEDELRDATEGVRRLNRMHGASADDGPFFLLLRDREWSASERRWMGWERKRGKLLDFNRLILGETSRLRLEVGQEEVLRRTRFVITLDADTILPRGVAGRLIGTLAHPLNRPVFDDAGQVVAGYTVLQPRIDIAPWSAEATPFSWIFSGEQGLDLYSRAVSSVYQDLFGEGIYVGKGIYDVAAFHRSLEGRVPESALLSHDLFEGCQGRAGLVSNVALLEEFPAHPLAWVRRQHRWIRGDWQISPWLLPSVPTEEGRWARNPLSLLDRWKIADNLRRSLVMPGLLALLLAGWMVLPQPIWWWTAIGILVPGIAFALGTLSAARARLRTGSIGTPREWVVARIELVRWAFAVVLLPQLAFVHVDAVVRALTRMVITRRLLLEWMPAYRAEKTARETSTAWKDMALVPLLAVGVGAALAVLDPGRLTAASPLLATWLASPAIVARLGRRRRSEPAILASGDRRRFRRVARRTWTFFESVLGPEDHWLPPDHVQESPRTAVARRTSPTNIGLTAAATLAAWDLGYLSTARLTANLGNLFDTLEQLERFRGHFLNWYETRRLTPLAPRYVSTVDSGNFACALVALARGLEAIPREPMPRLDTEPDGLIDAIGALREGFEEAGWEDVETGAICTALHAAVDEVASSRGSSREWRTALDRFVDERMLEIDAHAEEVVRSGIGKVDPRDLADLRESLRGLRHQAEIVRSESAELLPWLELPGEVLGVSIPDRAALEDVSMICAKVRRAVDASPALDEDERQLWRTRLDNAASRARTLRAEIAEIARRADALLEPMDFAFLYDRSRHLFHIGYDVDAGRYDPSWYDLLASEARAASLFGIATGAVPLKHWIHLGRPFRRDNQRVVLLSWAGTLFEYLMPGLFLETPRGSLLDFAAREAIEAQIEFGRRHHVPWGVSESAYNEFDADGGYRYRAFGVPDLALRRELEERVVIAPYASCLATVARPKEVARNFERLIDLGALGTRGFYEAVDFGSGNRSRRTRGRVVRSYMAHHQAMILLAIDNGLHRGRMIERFLSDPRMSGASFLLYENTPERVPAQSSFATAREHPAARAPAPAPPAGWGWKELAERPRVQILSNGRWSTLISDRGSGGTRWDGYALTRWRADPTTDRWGTWIYLQDLASGALWSATARPTRPSPNRYEVLFAPHAVEFHRHEEEIFSRLVVCVASSADVEMRRIHLRNDSSRRRRLGVTSFAEVALARQPDDRRHPAFSKLFVESRFDVADRALYFRRRGEDGPTGTCLAHAVILPNGASLVGWETDRGGFLGRTGRAAKPVGLRGGPATLSRTQGPTLDPALALGCEVELRPGDEVVLTFLTAVAGSERDALAAMNRVRSPGRIAWAMREAREHAAVELAEAGLMGEAARHAQALLCGLVYPCRHLRKAGPSRRESERPMQGELWAAGVSGDNPVMLLRVARPEDKAETMEVLRAHAWLRRLRVEVDLIIFDEGSGGYADPLQGWLQEAVEVVHGRGALGADGGVHYVPVGRLDAESRRAIEASAAVALDTEIGGLGAQLLEGEPPRRLPPFVPVRSSPPSNEGTPPLPPPEGLAFAHRRGGISPDGEHYVIRLEAGETTPAPWSTIVANPDFGFLVTERGGGFTWSENSAEHRLTPWSNDPVLDPPGEAIYLRDEETGEVWSATPSPAGDGAPYEVRHGAGVVEFRHHRHGLRQRLRFSVPPDAPVKLARLELANCWRRPRRLTVTFYAEWTLGDHRDLTASHVVTEFVPDPGLLLAWEGFSSDFQGRVALLGSSERIHGFTADRREFFGDGGPEAPAGLRRIGLGEATGSGFDPCAALQVHVDLAAGESRWIHFLLGEGRDREAALDLVRGFQTPAAAETAEGASRQAWKERLGSLVVHTPEPAMDAMLHRWLPHQTLACRLWARSGFYQSSGAFGFRDQLQDALAFLLTDPQIARGQIAESARRQFVEGDVLHWWHPPGGAGIRTRCSDDLVWLPYAIASYVEATDDQSLLDESAPFLEGRPLAAHEERRFDHFPEGAEGSLYEHGKRALERAWNLGPHGLPLIGGGDWNDGMDRVGILGQGESVWLAWFLLATVRSWLPICEAVEGPDAAAALVRRAETLREAIEGEGWDGTWYRRAYFDDGTPLGSVESEEAQIDSIAQSWAVLSAAASPGRARQAIESACERLILEDERLVLLLTPPFDRIEQDPGYIKAYPPGVRENGGQYTHAAAWLGCALAELGDGDRAEAVFRLLNPLLRARTEEAIEHNRVEPYAVAGDVCGAPPHAGRGGWTWYTGASGWLWRLGMEWILGIRRRKGELVVEPCIPRSWPGYEVTVRVEGVVATIRVENPDGVCRGVVEAVLDGRSVPNPAIPLGTPGAHELVVRLGAKS